MATARRGEARAREGSWGTRPHPTAPTPAEKHPRRPTTLPETSRGCERAGGAELRLPCCEKTRDAGAMTRSPSALLPARRQVTMLRIKSEDGKQTFVLKMYYTDTIGARAGWPAGRRSLIPCVCVRAPVARRSQPGAGGPRGALQPPRLSRRPPTLRPVSASMRAPQGTCGRRWAVSGGRGRRRTLRSGRRSRRRRTGTRGRRCSRRGSCRTPRCCSWRGEGARARGAGGEGEEEEVLATSPVVAQHDSP